MTTWKRLLGIGLPAGVEFALIGVYMVIVYAVSQPFGAAAQAGFGIGLRVVQAGFMPVVALGFAVAPVAGQNFGARLGDRVRETFPHGGPDGGGMMILVVLCQLVPAAMIRVFSTDPEVVAVGEEYLRIVSWNFPATGIVFIASSMFQALGQYDALARHLARPGVVVAIPTLVLSGCRGSSFAGSGT